MCLYAAGCGGLAWNVTPGLPTAFGARYVLNIWFPALPPSNSTSGSSGSPQRFALSDAPAPGANSSAAGNASASNSSPNGIQQLADVQAIVAIEPRRFFANISATNDYSYLDTPVLQAQQGSNSSDPGRLVRRRREPNNRMPAFIAQQLAWGSPPVGGTMVRGAALLLSYLPGRMFVCCSRSSLLFQGLREQAVNLANSRLPAASLVPRRVD